MSRSLIKKPLKTKFLPQNGSNQLFSHTRHFLQTNISLFEFVNSFELRFPTKHIRRDVAFLFNFKICIDSLLTFYIFTFRSFVLILSQLFKITESVNWVSVAQLSWAKWQNTPKIRLKYLENWLQHFEYEVHALSNYPWNMMEKIVKSHQIVKLFLVGFDYLKSLCRGGGCGVPANWVKFSVETKTNQKQKVFFKVQSSTSWSQSWNFRRLQPKNSVKL